MGLRKEDAVILRKRTRLVVAGLQRLPLIALCAVALGAAISCSAQATPTAVAPATAPTSPESPAANPTRPGELQWSAVGATAQCRDGTFFHRKFDQHSCADHGGIRKIVQVRGQDLIR